MKTCPVTPELIGFSGWRTLWSVLCTGGLFAGLQVLTDFLWAASKLSGHLLGLSSVVSDTIHDFRFHFVEV